MAMVTIEAPAFAARIPCALEYTSVAATRTPSLASLLMAGTASSMKGMATIR